MCIQVRLYDSCASRIVDLCKWYLFRSNPPGRSSPSGVSSSHFPKERFNCGGIDVFVWQLFFFKQNVGDLQEGLRHITLNVGRISQGI